MAEPTFAECLTQLTNATALWQEMHKFAHLNAASPLLSWRAREDALIQSLVGEADIVADIAAGLTTIRGYFAQALAGTPVGASGFRTVLDPLLLQFAKTVEVRSPQTDALAILDDLYTYMNGTALRVASRVITRGAPPAGSATAGFLLRLTVDKNNRAIEVGHGADIVNFVCVSDRTTGAPWHGQEVFRVYGRPLGDALEYTSPLRGCGLDTQYSAKSADDSILDNASMEGFDIPAGSLGEWTSSVAINATNYAEYTGSYYIEAVREGGAPKSLTMRVSSTITQVVGIGKIDKAVPHVLQLAFNAQDLGSTGTLTIRLGSQSVAVVVDGLTGWQVLRLPVDQYSWPEEFEQATTSVGITWAPTGATELVIDDCRLVPMDEFDGCHFILLGGSTPWTNGVTYTWTDSEVGSVIQGCLAKNYGKFLPHATGGGITIPDPTV